MVSLHKKLLNVLICMLIKQVMVSGVGIVKMYTYPKCLEASEFTWVVAMTWNT